MWLNQNINHKYKFVPQTEDFKGIFVSFLFTLLLLTFGSLVRIFRIHLAARFLQPDHLGLEGHQPCPLHTCHKIRPPTPILIQVTFCKFINFIYTSSCEWWVTSRTIIGSHPINYLDASLQEPFQAAAEEKQSPHHALCIISVASSPGSSERLFYHTSSLLIHTQYIL